MSAAIENPLPVNAGESKSARKKKAKAEATNGSKTAVHEPSTKDSSEPQENGTYEHPHIRELQKQIRNVNKRLTGLAKTTDPIVAENPGLSLDDLVKQKKINTDQKAAAEKKAGLQAQLQQTEEQVKVFRDVNADYQAQLQKQKDDLTAQHQKELEKAKGELQTEASSTSSSELRKKLLIFSQFLRTAAAKRNVEDDADSVENEAFEGALLLAYGGDEKAVDTAVAIIEGTDEQVPNIEGTLLRIKYSHIRKVSSESTPFQTEEAWVDSVAEANAAVESQQQTATADPDEPPATAAGASSDPTLTHAGLTELDAPQANGIQNASASENITSPANASAGNEAGNLAGDRWDTGAGAQQEALGAEEGYEMIPRPNDEVDTPSTAAAGAPAAERMLEKEKTSWADEATAASSGHADASTSGASGNLAGEAWDTKPAGQTETEGNASFAATQGNGWADTPADGGAGASAGNDGFQEISRPGRGRGGRGNGEFRGRGGYRGRGGPRGEGDGRGGRGGRGGSRGDRGRGEGEYRGRGGRGRGGAPRGDGGALRG